ncbi:MAG: hypothetical protein QGI83_11030 [Candidatus Latescibacteria bacterium]|nr:hypothetical protein [Candidatus Latescibacterota bacterium]
MEQPESGPETTGDPGEERQVHTVKDVTMEAGVVDFHDRNGVVSGNVYQGGVIRGDGDLLVQGTVEGAEQHPCTVEVRGSVVLEGAAAFTTIQAREILAKSDIHDSSITLDLGAEVGGDLSNTSVSIGNRSADILTARQHRQEELRKEQALGELMVRISSAARRFLRDYPQVDLRLGNVLVPTQRELKVDLGTFYQAVAGRSPEEVERALEEFYLKVMVGALTRANRHYISRNPSRHKIFLKLIDDLRQHIFAVRELDDLQLEASDLAKKREAIVKELEKPLSSCLRVMGEVKGEITVEMVQLSEFRLTPGGSVEMEKTTAALRRTSAPAGLQLELTSAAGNVQARAVGNEGWQNGSFRLQEGAVVWQDAE